MLLPMWLRDFSGLLGSKMYRAWTQIGPLGLKFNHCCDTGGHFRPSGPVCVRARNLFVLQKIIKKIHACLELKIEVLNNTAKIWMPFKDDMSLRYKS